MVPLRGKGSESQDRLNFKEEKFIMCNVEINVNNIGVDRVGDQLCLFGKIEWQQEDTYLTISFDSFPCNITTSTLRFLEMCPYRRNELIELPGLYIRYEGMEKDDLGKILRNIFAIALANIPEEFLKVDINIKEEWEEA